MVTDISRLTESPGPMLVKNGARYHDGEQIISHLNYALGPDGWDWEELERGYDEMADQVWVRGKLTARFVGETPNGYATTTATKIECGWNEVKRKRDDRTQLVDLGNDYKGADTDALKRAARLIGVGLDAWEKGGGGQGQAGNARPSGGQRTPSSGGGGSSTPAPSNDDRAFYSCAECRERLEDTTFSNGDVWTVEDLVGKGRRNFGRVLCLTCYRKASEAKKQQQAAG